MTDPMRLFPLLKWAGGKEQELKYILPNLPKSIADYYEPFVGGGSVYTAMRADRYFINDKSEELVSFYRSLANGNRSIFFEAAENISRQWNRLALIAEKNASFFVETYKCFSGAGSDEERLRNILFGFVFSRTDEFSGMFSAYFNFNAENFLKEIKTNLIRKMKRMRDLERQKGKLPDKDILDNIETAFKSAYYMHFRHLYNNTRSYKIEEALKAAIFFFIRNFAYSGMFRYNAKGDFNVPYGGIGYNGKNILKKVNYLKSAGLKTRLKATTIENLDFEGFFQKHKPTRHDFVFLDPPYDSEFSTYAKHEFTRKDQARLAKYLIGECRGKWMLIIKNTDFIRNLYSNKNLGITSFDKTYLVSFMNRNDKNAEHLLIRNY